MYRDFLQKLLNHYSKLTLFSTNHNKSYPTRQITTLQLYRTLYTPTVLHHSNIYKQLLSTSSPTVSPPSDRTLPYYSHLNRINQSKVMDSSNEIVDVQLREKALKICCEYLGGAWCRITPDEMSFTPVSGGMSNLLYCCSLPESIQLTDGEQNQALLRLYGDQSRNCDMSLQVQIFKLLSAKELGPKLFGDFEEGRLEEFLPATSLTCEELMNRDISSIIARKLAAVHSLEVPMIKSNTWLLEKFSEWSKFIKDQIKRPEFPVETRESTIKIANELLAIDFGKEIKFLCKLFDGTRSPIVFSHNDLHQGNILLAKPSKRRPTLDKRVILIDFEYCSYNYRAYDIANHFCEWCFEYDTPDYPHFMIFEDRFPTKTIQRDFIRNYLDQQKRIRKGRDSTNGFLYGHHNHQQNGSPVNPRHGTNIQPINKHWDNGLYKSNNGYANGGNIGKISSGTENGHGSPASDVEVEAILNEVKPFCMAANLVWTLWCIKSAHSSSIKFGYWEHAMTRWQLYSNFKRSYLKKTLVNHNNNNIHRH